MNKLVTSKKTLCQTFLVLILLELFLMGSGRMITLGPLTARMILFLFALVFSIYDYNKIENNAVYLVIIFVNVLFLAALVGLHNGSELDNVLLDIKPLLYLLMVIPFSILIKTKSDIFLIQKVIKLSGFFMAFCLLVTSAAIFFGYLDFLSVVVALSRDDGVDNDFMFGSLDGFRIFYKGFLYLNIAFIFYVFGENKYDSRRAILLLIAIFMTLTRGFLLGLIMAFSTIFLLEIKKKRSIIIIVSIILSILIFLPYYISFVGDRDSSNLYRYEQITQVFDAVTPMSVMIGHGFGIGVPVRPNAMEITFLEVFHKQGMLGLLFWFGLFGNMVFTYSKILGANNKKIATPFLISTFFVYFQSLTNPYLNNPIGMTMVLLTFVVLMVLSREERILATYKQ